MAYNNNRYPPRSTPSNSRYPSRPADNRYAARPAPARRPVRPQPTPPKQDPQALILLAALVIVVILAIILCVNLLGKDSPDEVKTETTVQPTVQATATPTITPVPTPTSEPTPTPHPLGYQVVEGVPDTLNPLGLTETPKVDDSYFDDTVFIGDSITLKLNYFVREYRQQYPTLLGNAKFLTAGSLGSGSALGAVTSNSLHPTYQGQKMLLEDSVAAMGARRVYIMLGMNDVAVYGPDTAAKNMMKLLQRIKEKSPNVQIFVQSATPRIAGDYKKLNNDNLFQYNLKLYEYCKQVEDYGVYFVDVAHVMRNENGDLPDGYCSDRDDLGMHFTNNACKIWIQYLYTHALV